MQGQIFTLKLHSKCNNNCLFCSLDKKNKYKISYDKAVNLIEKAKQKGVSCLSLQGGEPTIYPDITRLINKAKEIGYNQVSMVTNGRMFYYQKFCCKLFDAGLDNINLSIHGSSEEINDLLTRSKSFRQSIKGLKNIIRLKPKYNLSIYIRYILAKENLKDLSRFTRFIYSLDPKIPIEFCFPIPHGNAYINRKVIYPKSDSLVQALNEINVHRSQNILIRNLPLCMISNKSLKAADKDMPHLDYECRKIVTVDNLPSYSKGRVCRRCRLSHNCIGIHNELKKYLKPMPIA